MRDTVPGKFGKARQVSPSLIWSSSRVTHNTEKHSTTLLSPPHNIAPLLTSPLLLGPASDIKVKHGVVSLLKHLAQSSTRSPDNIAALINAGVAKSLASCGIWKEYTDQMRELVQVGAIGVLKHLCSASGK